MFSVLRFIVIVGVIFYYSPVRQRGDGPDPIKDFFSPRTTEPSAPPAAPPQAQGSSGHHLETMWQALPDGAKQAVVDKILAGSGLAPVASKPSDTLQPEDRAPGTHKPRI